MANITIFVDLGVENSELKRDMVNTSTVGFLAEKRYTF